MNYSVHAASYGVTAALQSLTLRRHASTNGRVSLKIARTAIAMRELFNVQTV